MKRITSIILSLIIIFSFASTAFAKDTNDVLEVVSEGQELLKFVISASEDPYEINAVTLLAERMKKIYGIDYHIYRENHKYRAPYISVGNFGEAWCDFSDKISGSYFIDVNENCVAINGCGNRGLIDGVYRFLSDFCGYEVYKTDVIEYTQEKTLSIKIGTHIDYTPFFEYRKVDTSSSYDPEFARANSLNSNVYFSNHEGGITEYISYFAHSFTTQFCAANVYFNEHPEYFALHDGSRTPDQLCLTNSDVLSLVTTQVLDLLKEKHDKNADLQIISLTQNDNSNYCECADCKALDDKNGSHAGTMLTFVNAVADVVKNAGYDNVGIDTFAYQYTRTVPTNVVPRDNVIVRLCSIECCYGHTIDDTSCEENVLFMQDLKGWSEICNRLYIWDYVNNYSETFLPFANFQVLQRNVQVYYENGAVGLYEEGNYYQNLNDGEFADLRSYLLSKLMMNPYRDDYEELMNNFCKAVYGDGAKYIIDFINLISEHSVTKRKHLHIRQQPIDCLPGMSADDIQYADALWVAAEEMAKTDKQLEAVQRSELCWEYWKCCKMKGEYSLFNGLYSYMKSHRMLYERLLDFGTVNLGEGDIKILREHPFSIYFLSPTKWESKYDGKFWHKFDPMAEKIYNFLGMIFD